MKIGTTSFSFRTLLRDARRAPSLFEIVEQCHELGLERLQICENARPLTLSWREWEALIGKGADAGLEIQLGCKTLDREVLDQHLERAAAMPARMLRIVLEEETGAPPGRTDIADFIKGVLPKLEKLNVHLAIENHFDVPSKVLADVAAEYPSPLLGFCVDSANSLRSFEPSAYVLDCLQPRAFCYHVKDFRVVGDQLGFRVAGAPLGKGNLRLDEFLDRNLRAGRQAATLH
ncbi:MAG: TIM barrel protein [Acidobacteriota bacterium]|nr:TIM barrel protein [Acidobacteriota bacterium]